ncbi:MAG: hypothetical protein K2Y18_04085 [Alphaproteobacteria bacterium]|jgi:hypothetical protein|nr:hypothetical protein [Alphaproteobacteria bacterium]
MHFKKLTSSILLSTALMLPTLGAEKFSLHETRERFADSSAIVRSASSEKHQYTAWSDQALVTESEKSLKSHSTLKQLTSDISLANELSYSIGKLFACRYFIKNIENYVQGTTERRDSLNALEFQSEEHYHKSNLILNLLARNGWVPALQSDNSSDDPVTRCQPSIIQGKIGSVLTRFVDNHSGIVLFHAPTGTLMPIFHGSRGDDYLPHSYDWDANLDAEYYELPLGPKGESVTVHRGFGKVGEYAHDSVQSIICKTVEERGLANIKRVLFSGHSHGGAVSEVAYMLATKSLGSQLYGSDFDNTLSNRFGHFGLSAPATVRSDCLELVRAHYGMGSFLSPGVSHDPVRLLFRADFWKGCDIVREKMITLENTFSGNVVKMLNGARGLLESRLGFSQVGYLACEPIGQVLQRQFLLKVEQYLHSSNAGSLVEFAAAIHYGGPGALFDHRLPGQIGNKLDTMLAYSQNNPMTIGQLISDIVGAGDTGMTICKEIGHGAVRLLQEATPSERAIGSSVLLAAAAVTAHSIHQDKKDGRDVNVARAAVKVAAAGAGVYLLAKGIEALWGWCAGPSERAKPLAIEDKKPEDKQLEDKKPPSEEI